MDVLAAAVVLPPLDESSLLPVGAPLGSDAEPVHDQQIDLAAAAVADALPCLFDTGAVAPMTAAASPLHGPLAEQVQLLSRGTDSQHCSTLARRAYLNGAPILVTHDTGATRSFLTHEKVHGIGLPVQVCQPVTVQLGDGSLIQISNHCKARLRILISHGTKPRYHMTTVTALVLPPLAAGSPPNDVDGYLGVDWQYANSTVLDFSKCPFEVSIAETASLTPQAAFEQPPALTGLAVLRSATDALYAASTVPLLSDRQCKRLMRQQSVASKAFVIVVSDANKLSDSAILARLSLKEQVAFGSTTVDPSRDHAVGTVIPDSLGNESAHLSAGVSSLEQGTKDIVLPAVGDGAVDSDKMSSLLQKYKHVFAEPTS
jgi:hypothetical protein